MKRKVLTVLFNISKAQEHEWFVRFINRNAFELEFALINAKGSFMHQFLESHNVPCHHFTYNGKKDLPALTFRLFLLMLKNKYDIVHAHLFEHFYYSWKFLKYKFQGDYYPLIKYFLEIEVSLLNLLHKNSFLFDLCY